MFYGKFNRAMEWLKQQNKDKKQDGDQEDLKLDRSDILALMLSALLVFGPIILFLIAVAILVWIT
ncbi:hypothetical protein [Caldicoprobacter sp.]|uniref:hypothetical protein n=1 Tax=Caldicoprobacter sp. TaxID=2004500 RepID=UPI0039C0C4D2